MKLTNASGDKLVSALSRVHIRDPLVNAITQHKTVFYKKQADAAPVLGDNWVKLKLCFQQIIR